MLGENYPDATPTPEGSGMSFIEQSGTPWENLAPVEPESSVEIFHSGKSQLNSSPLVEEAGGENYSMGGTSLDSDSGSVGIYCCARNSFGETVQLVFSGKLICDSEGSS